MAPVYAWPLMMIGYCALLWFLMSAKTSKQIAIYTFLFFFGYFLTSLYWVSSSLFVDLQSWWWALPFSFAGLPFILALFPTILLSIISRIKRFRIPLFIVGLIIADIARGFLFTGFPWNLPTHTWTRTNVMMVTLPHIGFWSLNSLTIILFCLPLLLKNLFRYVYIALFALITFIPITIINTESNLPDNIIMVQANISQHEKWDRNYIWRNFDRHIDMSLTAIKNSEPQVIIWPETAIAEGFIQSPVPRTEFLNFLTSLPKDSLLITGYLNYEGDNAYNSIAIFNRDGQIISKHDKHHLVPFGEYMPFSLDTVTGFSNFTAGAKPASLAVNKINFIPLICYESIFSKYVGRAENNALLLNLTNDSWFGNTAGPYQHFDHMIFRTMESGIPAVRLSGNGISAIIRSDGTPLNISKLNEQSIIAHLR